MRFKQFLTAIALLFTFTAANSASAADWCEVYSEAFTGSQHQTSLPEANFNNDEWSNFSVRRVADELKIYNVFHNVSSAKIRAYDSDVTLYAFTGDNFDGKVSPLHCEKGRVCTRQFGSEMNNNIGSFICQREYRRIPKGDSLQKAWIAANNPEFPMAELAQEIWDGTMKSMGDADMDNRSHRYTNVTWDTAYGRSTTMGDAKSWTQKYIDLIQIENRFAGKPKYTGYTRQIRTRTWIRPELVNRAFELNIYGTPYAKAWCPNHTESQKINGRIEEEFRDGIVATMTNDKNNNGINDMTESFRDTIKEVVGMAMCPAQNQTCMESANVKNAAAAVWGNKTALNIGHLPTNNELMDLEYNGLGENSMTDQHMSNPAGYGFDVTAFAPIIRLNWRR